MRNCDAFLRTIVAGCSWALVAAPAVGGTIYWNMNDLTTATSNGVPNLTVGAISQGNTSTTGTSTVSASSGYSFLLDGTSTSASGSNNLTFAAKANPLDSGSSTYLSVTLTPAAGYSGTVSAIGFGSRSTTSGPTTLALRSSTDNYAANIASFSAFADSAWVYFTNTFSTPVAFSNTAPLTLRLYGSGGSSANTGNWRLDDLQLTTVVVPEPAALALGVLGVAGAVGETRRRGRHTRKSMIPCATRAPALRSSNCSSSSPSSAS